jgi:tetratricopeptide (TPR) repeat protein
VKPVDIEPLLAQIEQLATHFGRVSDDLLAISARGRAGDFRGVMQNTRLVLEAIMRDLVTRELKQTVGKAMLDELISKFRQQANAGIIPTNILAHMGTVQAWGNLGAHDHAGSLTDEGVKVGREEVVASLNSMVAILNWYAAKLGVAAVAAPSGAVRPERSAPERSTTRRAPLAIGAAVLMFGLTAGGYLWSTRWPVATTAPLPEDVFAALDAAYGARGEPAPPARCRRADEAQALAVAKEPSALAPLVGPEADYLRAHLTYEAGGVPGAELQRAASCPGFAAALSLQGKVAVREAETAAKKADTDAASAMFGKAAEAFDAAIAAAPSFKNARFNRALVRLKQNKVDDGVRDLDALVASDPSFGEAHFYLGVALEAQARGGDEGLKRKAREEFCTAFKQGVPLAKSRCEAE